MKWKLAFLALYGVCRGSTVVAETTTSSFGDKDITAEPDPEGNSVADSPRSDSCATSARAPVLSVSEP